MDFSFAAVVEIVKVLGLPGIIFVIWWFDHKKIQCYEKTMNKYHGLCKDYKDLSEKYCKQSQDAMDTIVLNAQTLTRVEQKIENNRFCPLVRAQRFNEEKVDAGRNA